MARSVARARTDERDGHASFGFREVGLDEKQGLVDRVFERVAPRYDLMNDLMSGGMHRLWKDALVSRLAPPRKPRRPYHVLDVAGGTGDIAFRIADRSEGAAITVADINGEMLAVGRERAAASRVGRALTFVEANAEELPFAPEPFRRRDNRLRHPQRAADRSGAGRGLGVF